MWMPGVQTGIKTGKYLKLRAKITKTKSAIYQRNKTSPTNKRFHDSLLTQTFTFFLIRENNNIQLNRGIELSFLTVTLCTINNNNCCSRFCVYTCKYLCNRVTLYWTSTCLQWQPVIKSEMIIFFSGFKGYLKKVWICRVKAQDIINETVNDEINSRNCNGYSPLKFTKLPMGINVCSNIRHFERYKNCLDQAQWGIIRSNFLLLFLLVQKLCSEMYNTLMQMKEHRKSTMSPFS